MFSVLLEYYTKTHNDELGIMLGGFDTSITGKPFDPAAWGDWLNAVKKVTSQENITEQETRRSILELLKDYNEHHGFDLDETIEHFVSIW